MANHITNSAGSRLAIGALSVRPYANTRKIVSRMLDGSYTVQQIGMAATRLDIIASVADKSELDAVCAACEQITVFHYGKTYTGIISSEEIAWEPIMPGDRWYKGSFSLVVSA